jgi:hypothetical protein
MADKLEVETLAWIKVSPFKYEAHDSRKYFMRRVMNNRARTLAFVLRAMAAEMNPIVRFGGTGKRHVIRRMFSADTGMLWRICSGTGCLEET